MSKSQWLKLQSRGPALLVAAAVIASVSALIISHSVAMTKTTAPNPIAPVDATCTSSSPCVQYLNTGTGAAIKESLRVVMV